MNDSFLWSIVLAASLVVLALALQRSLRAKKGAPAPFGPPPRTVPDAMAVQRVTELVGSDRRVEAVKFLRQATGLGLVEAKQRVDRWGAAGPEPVADEVDRSALDAEIRAVVAEHGEIAGMKRLRQRTGWGLADTKAYLDQLGPR
ncbi:MAG: hypothetical protein EON52_13895 [Actinomycetales bacterium]|nr:MAG: hypothetical protein EON52_13895 [Actinomycetales bacterium]